MPKRQLPLVTEYLEDLHRRAFDEHRNVMDKLSRRRHGVYALYKRGRLYYVGLAKDLRNRVKTHLKDQHAKKWDTFRLYLTIDNKHMRELESLLIRIANPEGNKRGGRFAKASNLRKKFKRLVDEEHKARVESLYGPRNRAEARAARLAAKLSKRTRRGADRFAGLVSRTIEVRWKYKGKVHKARFRKDGKLRYKGRLYDTPTDATPTICKHRYNGWHVWRYQRSPSSWVLLKELRSGS